MKIKGWKSDSVEYKRERGRSNVYRRGKRDASRRKKPEREPECERMGGLINRWAEGGQERWWERRRGLGEEAARR